MEMYEPDLARKQFSGNGYIRILTVFGFEGLMQEN